MTVVTKKVGNANDVVLDYMKHRVEETRFTGKIITHCNLGVMRKVEEVNVVTTEELLTWARSIP